MTIEHFLTLILALTATHYIADFKLQTERMGTKKNDNAWILLQHVFIYTLAMSMPMVFWQLISEEGSIAKVFIFSVITFGTHFFIDMITSKITSKAWKETRIRAFIHTIGFDQLLHYFQLFLTLYLLWH